MSECLYYVGRGGPLWTDVRNWSRTSGGPTAGCRPSPADVLRLDESSGTGEVNLVGCPHRSLSISGFCGVVTLPAGGRLDMRPAPAIPRWRWLLARRPPRPRIPASVRDALTARGMSWQAAVRRGLATLNIRDGTSFVSPVVSGGVPIPYFWVGGAGTWDNAATTHWSLLSGGLSGAGPPTASDPVTFDSGSGLGSGGTVTVASTAVCGGCVIGGINSKTVFFSFSGNPTWSAGTYTFAGNSATTPILFQSTVVGTQRTLTINGTHGAHSWVHFMDFKIAGTAGTLTGTLIGDCLGNGTGITFEGSAPQTATGTASFTWSTHGWTSRVPLPQDDVSIPNAFVAGRTITADMPRLGRSIDASGCTGSPAFFPSSTVALYGNLAYATGMTTVGSNTLICRGRSAQTITTNAVANVDMQIAAPSGSYTLQDDYSSRVANLGITVANGGFNANNKAVYIGNFSNGGGATKSITLGNKTWTLTGTGTVWVVPTGGTTFSGASATIDIIDTSSNSKTFTGNGFTYGTLRHTATGSAALTITGSNTYANLDLECTTARTVTLPASGTQTVTGTLTLNGAAGQLLSLVSSSPGTGTTILVTLGGNITDSFLSPSADVSILLNKAGGAASTTTNGGAKDMLVSKSGGAASTASTAGVKTVLVSKASGAASTASTGGAKDVLLSKAGGAASTATSGAVKDVLLSKAGGASSTATAGGSKTALLGKLGGAISTATTAGVKTVLVSKQGGAAATLLTGAVETQYGVSARVRLHVVLAAGADLGVATAAAVTLIAVESAS